VQEAKDGARLDAVYCSDLLRAQQTAEPFADALGLALNLNEGLWERPYVDFKGRSGGDPREVSRQIRDLVES